MPQLGSLLMSAYRPFRRRTAPGESPGTFVTNPESPKPEIHVIRYDTDELTEVTIEDVRDLPPLLEQAGVIWVNVYGLGDAAIIQQLGEIFDVHKLALEDVVHVHQRAKVEEYEEHLFIVCRMVSLKNKRLETEQLSMFLGSNFVLTFQERLGDCLEPVRERIRKKRGRIRNVGADYLAYALIDAILDGYFPVLEGYGNRLDEIEGQVVAEAGNEAIAAIHRIRGDLLVLRKTIWPHREAVNTLLRDVHPLIHADTLLYLRDCYDHTVQIIDVTETYREVCSDLRDFHFSQVSQRTNDVMRVLTIIATIFIPLSFVAGLYGMNFDPEASPWNMPELKWRYGYPFALTVMASMTVGLLVFFWKRGWIMGK